MRNILYIGIISLLFATGGVTADWLPNQTPENQMFSITTVIDVVGYVSDSTSLSWVIASPGAIPTGILAPGQSVADVSYHDSTMTNGGHLMMNKRVDFDSGDQTVGTNNLETQKVMTYSGIDGSHLVGEEEYTLSVAGRNSTSDDAIRCVFSQGLGSGLPSFCNIVTAKSSLINVNSAQISSKGGVRAVAENANTPATLNYQIAVTPDTNSGSGYADAIVKTEFAGSIMEARDTSGDNWNKTSATNTWKDSSSVSGGIKNFQKSFGYTSGLRV
ncbi:hypothetical protein [Methanospirillum lacunae]|uniref:Uncharacterized protein n=1 Tax=Methanospirillum lacunae TaxID=668570 RepID=A0A2V2ND68_9EURY|nr:hypothetical protein [Methanospirillum lacunae]PWR74358.1 hypothetical protein DK846_04200 [Methanospirillum lacunae]